MVDASRVINPVCWVIQVMLLGQGLTFGALVSLFCHYTITRDTASQEKKQKGLAWKNHYCKLPAKVKRQLRQRVTTSYKAKGSSNGKISSSRYSIKPQPRHQQQCSALLARTRSILVSGAWLLMNPKTSNSKTWNSKVYLVLIFFVYDTKECTKEWSEGSIPSEWSSFRSLQESPSNQTDYMLHFLDLLEFSRKGRLESTQELRLCKS